MVVINKHGSPVRPIAPWYLRRDIDCPQCLCNFTLTPQDMATMQDTNIVDINASGLTNELGAFVKWREENFVDIPYANGTVNESVGVYGSCPECKNFFHVNRLMDGDNSKSLNLDNTNIAWEWARVNLVTYGAFIRTAAGIVIFVLYNNTKQLMYAFNSQYPTRALCMYQDSATLAIFHGIGWTPESHYEMLSMDVVLTTYTDWYNYVVHNLGLIILNQ